MARIWICIIDHFSSVDFPVELFKICLMVKSKNIILPDGISMNVHVIQKTNTTYKKEGKMAYTVVRVLLST